jgi:LPS biosynthesis protein
MRPEEIDMKDVWAVEQSILDQIARVCDDHGLRWSLAYGTLLGAVRHGGFIPWDDDVDIMMPREDYEKLMALWPEVAPAGLILDRCDRDPENCNVFSKVRKDHTTFLQFPNEGQAAHHKGIFNDIFPAEHVPKGKLARKLQFADFAVMLLFNRGYPSGSGGLVGLAERILLRLVPKKKYFAVSQVFARRGRRWNDKPAAALIYPVTIRDCKRYYPADLFDDLQRIQFQGKRYSAFAKAEEFLTIRYGDFRRLPPKEEQVWKHPPLLIDYTRNYEELSPAERELGPAS